MRVASAASPSITGTIGCSPGRMLKPLARHALAEQFGIGETAARAIQKFPSSRSRTLIDAATIGGATRIRKQIGTRALAQQIDDLFSSAGVAAAGAAQRFAQRAGQNVDAAHHVVMFVRAASRICP